MQWVAGIDEDPVTGSAHAALAPYWAEKSDRHGRKAVSFFHAQFGRVANLKAAGNLRADHRERSDKRTLDDAQGILRAEAERREALFPRIVERATREAGRRRHRNLRRSADPYRRPAAARGAAR